jgi:hypothetical protein
LLVLALALMVVLHMMLVGRPHLIDDRAALDDMMVLLVMTDHHKHHQQQHDDDYDMLGFGDALDIVDVMTVLFEGHMDPMVRVVMGMGMGMTNAFLHYYRYHMLLLLYVKHEDYCILLLEGKRLYLVLQPCCSLYQQPIHQMSRSVGQ